MTTDLIDVESLFPVEPVAPLARLEFLRAQLEAHREALEPISEAIQALQDMKVSEDSYDMSHQRAKYGRARDAYLAWEAANMEELARLEEVAYWGARHYEDGGALMHGNPHPEATDAYAAWALGWLAAQELAWAPILAPLKNLNTTR